MSLPPINSIDDYETYLHARLADLRPEQRAAFCAAMAERYLPVYAAFSKAEEWGDAAGMRRALDAVWDHLSGRSLGAVDIRRYRGLVHDATPHMDDFDAGEALAAAVLVGEAVDACQPGNNLNAAIQAAISGFEAVMPGWSDDPREQMRLWKKKAVRQEFSQQVWLLDRVQAVARFDETAVRALRGEVTLAERMGKLPEPKAPAAPPGLTNQALFEQYRRMVEADIKTASRAWPGVEMTPMMQAMIVLGHWGGRYSRRRQTIDGSYGKPADTIAQQALVARSKALDAGVVGTPNWHPDAREMIEMSYSNPLSLTDARALQAPHGYGPSIRRLWIEATNRGLTEAAAWQAVTEWAFHRPEAWAVEDQRKKKGRGYTNPALVDLLARPVDWQASGDPFIPWHAEVEGAVWQVRLNDFPDDFMYSLITSGQDQGRFHDWPETWTR